WHFEIKRMRACADLWFQQEAPPLSLLKLAQKPIIRSETPTGWRPILVDPDPSEETHKTETAIGVPQPTHAKSAGLRRSRAIVAATVNTALRARRMEFCALCGGTAGPFGDVVKEVLVGLQVETGSARPELRLGAMDLIMCLWLQ